MPVLLHSRGQFVRRGEQGVGLAKAWYLRHWRAGFRGRWRLAAYALVGLWVIVASDVVIGTPDPAQIRGLVHMPEATKVFDVNGQLAFTIFKERRITVPLSDVSPSVTKAVLAIEDQRFYSHHGVDVWRIGGALVANVRHAQAVQGASTISMQLARKSFLTDDRTIRRKLKEAFLAVRIEWAFTKDEILEHYLNKVYFGNGYYGIEAASRGYFNKTAKTVDVAEAALLAGLIQAPSSYDPSDHPDRAKARRTTVLRQMVSAGFIDATLAGQLEKTPVTLVNGFEHERSGQYFKNHMTRALVDQFGWDRLSQGGLKVYATIDAKMQLAAEEAMVRGLDAAEKQPGFKHLKHTDPRAIKASASPKYLQGALVAMDPVTGEVRAMIGGRDFDESQYNRAVQSHRQAGSAFKPFVYAAAIDSGYTPATLVTGLDSPLSLPDGAWLPEDGHSTATSMTIRTALRTSSNRAAVQVLRAVTIPTAVTYAKRLGLDAPAVPSLVLGAGDVTVLSMASAYGVFANGGLLRSPVFIRKVEDADGRVLFSSTANQQPSRAISEETAFLMAQMLADVVNSGTGYRAREAGFRFAAGGKTGTTNDYRDAWFIGFTPALVTSVWVGFDDPQTIVPGGYAGQIAAPIWGRFMAQAAGATDAGWIRKPEGVVGIEICRLSGGLASEGCRRAVVLDDAGNPTDKSSVGFEFFRRGTEPLDECPIHGNPVGSGSWRSVIGAGAGIGIRGVAPLPLDATRAVTPSPSPVAFVSVPPVAGSKTPAPPAGSAVAPPAANISDADSTAATPSARVSLPAPPPAPRAGLVGAIKKIFGKGKTPAPPPAKPTGRGGGGY